MEIVINRIKYNLPQKFIDKLIVSQNRDLPFVIKLEYFLKRFGHKELEKINNWIDENAIDKESFISYGFSDESEDTYLNLTLSKSFEYAYTIWLLSIHFKKLGFFIFIKPKAIDLSCYQFDKNYNETWDIYKRWDFKFNTNYQELTFNLGSSSTFISSKNVSLKNLQSNFSIIMEDGFIQRSNHLTLEEARIIANREIKQNIGIENVRNPINYISIYNELKQFFNENLRKSERLIFHSVGFDSIRANKVSFSKNKMLFGNGETDINPISGMRNYGVYKDAPESLEKQFIFIYQHNDDANTLHKYLKNGHKGFPGLQPYVNIPMTLANSVEEGKFKGLEYANIGSLIEQYEAFEQKELSEDYYQNLFAIVIGPFDKDAPHQEYYDLKLALIKKGVPSQFINYENIRKAGVFNYHLPNIAIGIHAKMGGIPWRLNTPPKNELVIGFNQILSNDNRFIGSAVFFDNQGQLKSTQAFHEQNSSNEMVALLKEAIENYLAEDTDIQRLVIHYHKNLSKKEQGNIEAILREELNLSIPYAVVEINDTKSKLEMGFDPQYEYKMPVSGSYVKLNKREYLLFNNNRFKEIAPVGIKDELPLKLKIHFADESGFSHSELIEQVYEFSRLIWKGLKQRSQPATCYYAKEIARFKSAVAEPIPNNPLTQSTPWVI